MGGWRSKKDKIDRESKACKHPTLMGFKSSKEAGAGEDFSIRKEEGEEI